MSGHAKLWRGSVRLIALVAVQISCQAVALSSHAAEHTIEIQSFKFVPERLDVKVGDTITWINRDIAPHTATALSKTWDTKRLKKGESMSVVVTKKMELDYFCRFHPHMKAKLVLKPD